MPSYLVDVTQHFMLTRLLTTRVTAPSLAAALDVEAPPYDDPRWKECRTITSEDTSPHRPEEDEWVTVVRSSCHDVAAKSLALRERGIQTRCHGEPEGYALQISQLQLVEAFEAIAGDGQQPAPTTAGDIRLATSHKPEPVAGDPTPGPDGIVPHRVTQQRYVPLDAPHHGGEQAAHVVLTIDGRDTQWAAWGFGTLRDNARQAAYANAVALVAAAIDVQATDDHE